MNTTEQDVSPLSGAALFANENLARAENRINVAIFGAQAIPAFWLEFASLIQIPIDAWMERIVLDQTSLRPDFLVKQDDRDFCWIEVELGSRNEAQLAAYRAKLVPSDVRSIVGKTSNEHGDPSLEEVSAIAKMAPKCKALPPQAAAVLRALAHLIDTTTLGGSSKASKADIPAPILTRYGALLGPLLALREKGFVENLPVNPLSLSLRLKKGPSVQCADSFALLTMTEPANFLVPSPDEMDRIFQSPLKQLIKPYTDLLNVTYPAWQSHVDGNERIKVPVGNMEQNAAGFAAMYGLLRQLLTGDQALPLSGAV